MATQEKNEKSSVTSHTAKPDPKTPEGQMMIGYDFAGQGIAGGTPMDYLKDSPYRSDPWGIQITDLRDGIGKAVLPPLLFWELGSWFSEVVNFPWASPLTEDEEWGAWLVDAQGTPGALQFRIYIVPDTYAAIWETPKHPMMWKKKEKDGQAKTRFFNTRMAVKKTVKASEDTRPTGTNAGNWGHGTPVAKPAAVVAVPAAPKAPALPYGVRFRCAECGHWNKETDLAAHYKVCPGIHGEDGASDWAIMCHDDCGCEYIAGFPSDDHTMGVKTLDHVSRCKPGYPKPVVAKEVKEVEEEKEVAETPETNPEEGMETVAEAPDTSEATQPAES